MKKKIFTLCIILIITIFSITSYAWYISKSNVGYIVSSNVDLFVNGYYSYTDTYNNEKQVWTNLNEEKQEISIEFDYSLNFAFVITNNSDKDIDLSLRLSDFSSYIFTSFDGTNTVSDSTKKNLENHNTKFFLYIDSLKIKDKVESTYKPDTYDPTDKTLTDIELNQDSNYECNDNTNFLWRYSYNNMINKNKIKFAKGESKVIYLVLKNRQSQESLQDYTNWLYSYGINYIKNNTIYIDEDAMKSYFEAYYKCERESLYYQDESGQSVLKDTKLCIDYFEFIADL